MPVVPNIQHLRGEGRSPILDPRPSDTNLLMAAAEMDRLGLFTQPNEATGPVTQRVPKRRRSR